MAETDRQTWLNLLRLPAFREELLWFALLATAVTLALAAGVDTGLAIPAGLSIYALWHLLQALRLLRSILTGDASQPAWAWGLWREVFAQLGRMIRREQKRKRRQQRFFSRFRRVASAMPDAVILLGSDGEIDWFNQQASLYFGLTGGSGQGGRLVDRVDHGILQDYLEAGDYGRVLETEAPGDPSLILSISVTRFKRKRQRYLLVARDITRQYHLNRSRRDFTLNVSHELRTPLTVLHGYLEALFEAEQPQSPRWKPIKRMIEQTRRMQAVIEDMLTLTRLEEGSESIRREPAAVFEILEDIVRDGREMARETEHVLELNGDPGLRLLGDESLLRCAFSNLIFNAIRHTPVRTRVEISWGREGEEAVLQVNDNGAGIPARHLPRLMERFYRVDPGRSRDAGGSGLGLAIVGQILDLHDAKMLISSEEGRGSSFGCLFPAERIQGSSEDPPLEEGASGPLG
jgi:two-component system phosphate regulon sensor histidine kinase PhoR